MRLRPGVAAYVLAAALVVVWVVPASAQGTLGRVEELAGQGRAEEARALLLTWWEDERGGASRPEIQHGFWLRGRLTVDPDQAARDYRRLVVEYPGGPYTDRALFRLAQAAYASGDVGRSREYMTTLARDYPGSAVRHEAEAWMLGAGAPQEPAQRSPTEESERIRPETETREAARPPTAEAVAEEPPPTPEPTTRVDPAPEGRYSVQLGAFAEEERARTVYQQAVDAGLEARIVRVVGSRLVHVRVGRFDSSGEASVFFRRVTSMGFTAAVVRDADKEEPTRS